MFKFHFCKVLIQKLYLSLAQITDRESITGTALVLILALIFKVTEISDHTFYVLVQV